MTSEQRTENYLCDITLHMSLIASLVSITRETILPRKSVEELVIRGFNYCIIDEELIQSLSMKIELHPLYQDLQRNPVIDIIRLQRQRQHLNETYITLYIYALRGIERKRGNLIR